MKNRMKRERKKSSSRVECLACMFLYPCSVLGVPNHWAVVVTGQAENKLQVLSRSSSSSPPSPHLLRFLSRIPAILLCLLLVLYLLVSSWLSIMRLMPVSYMRLLAPSSVSQNMQFLSFVPSFFLSYCDSRLDKRIAIQKELSHL